MVELWILPVVGLFAVAFGYVWLRHAISAEIEAATAEQAERLDRLERRVDALEASDDDR